MSAESDYIRAERDNILRTIDMIEDLTSRKNSRLMKQSH